MTHAHYIPLIDRTIVEISGDDARTFLQGLITNDVEKLSPENAIYACLLTPQGKFLFDFFIVDWQERLFLDCGATRADELVKRLTMYKLRSQIDIHYVGNKYEVVAVLGPSAFDEIGSNERGTTKPFCKGIVYIDPRTHHMFARSIIEKDNHYQSFEAKGLLKGDVANYETLRVSLGVPDGTIDLIPESSFPLQYKMEEMHAIDFEKGCYVGQEVHYPHKTPRNNEKNSI